MRRAYADDHTAAVEIVSGPKLLGVLTQLFGPNRYTTRAHD